jgi:hypothetical protein
MPAISSSPITKVSDFLRDHSSDSIHSGLRWQRLGCDLDFFKNRRKRTANFYFLLLYDFSCEAIPLLF